MRFRMLGPLEVLTDAGWLPVAAERQRLVLAVLLVDAGRAVSTERLVDAVWGDRPPRGATNTVQAYVMRLRRLLGDGVLATRGRGYELVVGSNDVDAAVFERLVAAGRRELDDGRAETGAARLAKALVLWRGPVFADVPASASLAARVTHLDQARLAAEEDHIAALLDLDQHAQVVDELHRLVEASPLRERRWALLMRALDRSGRRAEALDVFQRARRVLLDELGLDPGQELRHLQLTILAEDAPPARVTVADPPAAPAQLPADVSGFTGRDRHLVRLDAVLREHSGTTAVVISAIAGTAGVGKTALAVRWAHRMRDQFSDGQLYVNLRGHAAGAPVRPIDALARFLRALGVAPEQIPPEVDEAGALYRSLLAGRRILVVLDNARDPDQVRPLLPGSGGCLALVTSRDRLGGLVARDGATSLTLDVLTDTEARALLGRLLGADRVHAEPAAAAELARLCGNLPLALRIAAANLSARPHASIAAYTAHLRNDRLAGLAVDGDPQAGVRAAFDLSYAALPDETRRLFRLLGLVPSPDVTAAAAAALTASDAMTTERLLDRLAAAHLVDEHVPGRYGMHDLIRSYAAERATTEESDTERRAALDRHYDHYLDHVDAAAKVLYPEVLRLPGPSRDSVDFDSDTAAAAWIEAERPNLVAVVVHTATHGPHQLAWSLADALRGFFLAHMSTVDWQAIAESGLAAAGAGGDEHALAAGYFSVGLLHSHLTRDYEQAIAHYTRAVIHGQHADWPEAESAGLGSIGGVYLTQGQFEAAADHYSRTLAVRRRLGWLGGQATALGNLGLAHLGLGRPALAAECNVEAAAIHRQIGAAAAEARINASLGVNYHELGRLHEAAAILTTALAVLREAGDRYSAGHALYSLARLHRDLGNLTEALGFAEAALTVAREIGERSLICSALIELASIHDVLGEHRAAFDELSQALTIARDVGDAYLTAEVLSYLASTHLSAGRFDDASDVVDEALDLVHQGGFRLLEGHVLTVLAVTYLANKEHGDAHDTAHRALSIHAETGHLLGQARAHLVAAEAQRRNGGTADADTHDTAAQALFTETGADPTPYAALLVGPDAYPPPGFACETAYRSGG